MLPSGDQIHLQTEEDLGSVDGCNTPSAVFHLRVSAYMYGPSAASQIDSSCRTVQPEGMGSVIVLQDSSTHDHSLRLVILGN